MALLSTADASTPRQSRRAAKRARRVHGELQLEDGLHLSEAFRFARALGAELNIWATAHWKHASSAVHPVERIGRILERAYAFLRRRGVEKFAWAYCRERVSSKLEHFHMAIHVPAKHHAAFGDAFNRWVAADATEALGPTAVRVESITPGTDHRIRNYMLKAGDEETRRRFGVRRKGSQGLIEGSRLKVSHSIGRAARAAAAGSEGVAYGRRSRA